MRISPAGQDMLAQLQEERAVAQNAGERVVALTREERSLVPPAVAKLDAAWRATEHAVRCGWSRTEKAMRFGVAAAASPVVAPIIGNQVAGLPGSGLGLSLGLGKCAEFMAHSGRNVAEAAWLPPWLAGEAMMSAAQGALLGILGNPGFGEHAQAVHDNLCAAQAAHASATQRVQALEEALRNVAGADAVPRLPTPPPAPVPRPKVVVVSLSAGGGHDAAARAIIDALGDGYEVKVVHPFDDGVEAYNAAQTHTPPQFLDLFGYMQRITNMLNQVVGVSDALYGETLDAIFAAENPALVVSTAPMENATTLRAARRHGCPMVVVPTDLQFAHFVETIHDVGNDFKLLLPFAHTRGQAGHLPDHAVAVTGYPVRREFTTEGRADALAHPSRILQDLGIAPNDRLVLVMMGARGSGEDVIVADAQDLANALPDAAGEQTGRIHVAVLRGHNAHIDERLQPLAQSSRDAHVPVHVLGPRDAGDVAALMEKADVLITKPGGSTVNEALAANLPMIFHSEVPVVHWELGNATYATEHGMAQWVARDALAATIAETLRRGRPQHMQECPSRDFPAHLRAAVQEVLHGATP